MSARPFSGLLCVLAGAAAQAGRTIGCRPTFKVDVRSTMYNRTLTGNVTVVLEDYKLSVKLFVQGAWDQPPFLGALLIVNLNTSSPRAATAPRAFPLVAVDIGFSVPPAGSAGLLYAYTLLAESQWVILFSDGERGGLQLSRSEGSAPGAAPQWRGTFSGEMANMPLTPEVLGSATGEFSTC